MTTAFLVFRPAAVPATAVSQKATDDLVRLFALDRLPAHPRLICHWQRTADGRLTGVWESERVHAAHC
jgi:hypothetical protein